MPDLQSVLNELGISGTIHEVPANRLDNYLRPVTRAVLHVSATTFRVQLSSLTRLINHSSGPDEIHVYNQGVQVARILPPSYK